MLSGELIHKSRVHLSRAIEEALHVKPQTSDWRVSTGRAVVIHASGDMLSPLAPSSVSRHQVVSWQSAGMQMCSQQRLNCYDSPICHRICSLPTALGPKLVSVQDIPAVWWIPLAACLVIPCFRSKGLLPPLSSLLCSSMSFITPRFCSLFFHKEILVNKAVRSKGPNHGSRGRHITLPDGALMLRWISRCSNS